MQALQTLIDNASKVCGSDTALAKRMGMHQPDIAALRSGKRKMSPEVAVVLAGIAGMDTQQAAIDAIVERNRGTRLEGAMRELLGKAIAAGVAGLLLSSYNEHSNAATEKIATTTPIVNLLYIV